MSVPQKEAAIVAQGGAKSTANKTRSGKRKNVELIETTVPTIAESQPRNINCRGRWPTLRHVLTAVSLLCCGAMPLTSSLQTQLETYEDRDAYDVYVAALSLGRAHQDSIERARMLVIREEVEAWERSTIEWTGIKLARNAKKDWEPVLKNLISANQKPRKLIRAFSLRIPYELVSKSEINDSFQNKGLAGWEAFYSRFPDSGGYVWFSAVGFNREKTKAIVFVNHMCGSLCGGGGPHFLEKKNGKWVPAAVDASVSVWAS